MSGRNPIVDGFFTQPQPWLEEFARLREIILRFDLNEELKWGVPCYGWQGKNVLLIHGFKEYCAVLFVKGSLLKDPEGILVRQTENVQAGRQVRFRTIGDVEKQERALERLILDAIEIEKTGGKIESIPAESLIFPEEFQRRMADDPVLRKAFDALTPGRKRAYHLAFSSPKQSKTRMERIEKAVPLILAGKGWDER